MYQKPNYKVKKYKLAVSEYKRFRLFNHVMKLIFIVIFFATSNAVYYETQMYCKTVDECLSMLPSFDKEATLSINEKHKFEEIFSRSIEIDQNNPHIYQKRVK